ncbi:MAG: hypothetical protein ACE5JB_01165 [bacterium]
MILDFYYWNENVHVIIKYPAPSNQYQIIVASINPIYYLDIQSVLQKILLKYLLLNIFCDAGSKLFPRNPGEVLKFGTPH